MTDRAAAVRATVVVVVVAKKVLVKGWVAAVKVTVEAERVKVVCWRGRWLEAVTAVVKVVEEREAAKAAVVLVLLMEEVMREVGAWVRWRRGR